jgi:transposase
MWTAKDREKYKDDGRRYPSDLTDTEWATIATLLSGYFTFTADIREMGNACFYLEHTGCQWRSLPKDFGPWQTVRTWHDRFRADGIWADMTALLTRRVRKARGHAAEPATGIMDSQSVVSGPQKGERGLACPQAGQRPDLGDGNKKIKGIKRHVLTCSLGFVLAIVVTAANNQPSRTRGFMTPGQRISSCSGPLRTGSRPSASRSMRSIRVPRSKPPPNAIMSNFRYPRASRKPPALPRCRCVGASKPPSAPPPTGTAASPEILSNTRNTPRTPMKSPVSAVSCAYTPEKSTTGHSQTGSQCRGELLLDL